VEAPPPPDACPIAAGGETGAIRSASDQPDRDCRRDLGRCAPVL